MKVIYDLLFRWWLDIPSTEIEHKRRAWGLQTVRRTGH